MFGPESSVGEGERQRERERKGGRERGREREKEGRREGGRRRRRRGKEKEEKKEEEKVLIRREFQGIREFARLCSSSLWQPGALPQLEEADSGPGSSVDVRD